MAQEQKALAYFRARGNDKAPLFRALYPFDAEQMRKHPDFFECDADGKGLKGEVAESKAGREPAPVVVAAPQPAAEPLRSGKRTISLGARVLKS